MVRQGFFASFWPVSSVPQQPQLHIQSTAQPNTRRRWTQRLLWGLGMSSLTLAVSLPASAAAVLSVRYSGIELPISVQDLDAYARTGRLNGDLQAYAGLLSQEQLATLREVLQQRLEVSPTLVAQLARSKTGEILLERIGDILQAGVGKNGGPALQRAILGAVESKEGLTVISLMRQFPEPEIRVDVNQGLKIAAEANRLFSRNNRIIEQVEKLAIAQASTQDTQTTASPSSTLNPGQPLTQAGPQRWQKLSFNWIDSSRNRSVPTDLYLPQAIAAPGGSRVSRNPPAPLVIISHGLASNRTTFAYLGQHLASYGFAVAILEHVGSNSDKFKLFFDGISDPPKPDEAFDRTRDLTFVLDQLGQLSASDPRLKGRLALDQVGAIGQSLGAYTVLNSAGARVNFAQLSKVCRDGKPLESFLNISMLLQCRLEELKNQAAPKPDPRIKAVIAINSFTSQVFGAEGIAPIQVPTMMVSGSADVVVPAVEEQFYAFSWLKTRDRYLVVMRNATHFSTLADVGPAQKALPVPDGLIGPKPEISQRYLSALSVAFMKTHLVGDRRYGDVLTPSAAKALSNPVMPLSLLQQLSTSALDNYVAQVTQAMNLENPPPP